MIDRMSLSSMFQRAGERQPTCTAAGWYANLHVRVAVYCGVYG